MGSVQGVLLIDVAPENGGVKVRGGVCVKGNVQPKGKGNQRQRK